MAADKKYQVFVSSTYQDLKDEREKVVKAVLEIGQIPVAMEMFSAADEEQWKIIAKKIDDCDYYVVILAHRYGSLTPDGQSYTEKEYDYAVSIGVPTLGFVIEGTAAWPQNRSDGDRAKIQAFKEKVQRKLVKFWSTAEDLHGKVAIGLMTAINTTPREGWVRADQAADPSVATELSRLSRENATLRRDLDEARAQVGQEAEAEALLGEMKGLVFKVRLQDGSKTDCPHTVAFEGLLPMLLLGEQPEGIVTGDVNTAVDNWLLASNSASAVQVGAASILADLSALGLVKAHKKAHNSGFITFWALTSRGELLAHLIRKAAILARP